MAALPPEPIRSALTPPLTRMAWLEFVLVHVPILRWVLEYQFAFLISDIVSGITVAIMHIPQGKWHPYMHMYVYMMYIHAHVCVHDVYV